MSMSVEWRGFLYLLWLIPLIVAVYVWALRRRRRFVVRYSSLSLVREAALHPLWWRRHLSFILFVLALTSLIAASSRPTAAATVPSDRSTIILAMDVSRSMCTVDIQPNRLEAAKKAALAFVEREKTGRKIGIVAFAGFAELIQPPTDDHYLLENAILNLTTARRTAIGSAVLRSLETIAEFDDQVAPIDPNEMPGFEPAPAPAEFSPHMIVLLTDGSSNAGPNPLSAAQEALERGVRIYTIGFGTVDNSSPMNCGELLPEEAQSGGPGAASPGSGGGQGSARELDEATLIQVADMTGGAYFSATSAGELQTVFENIPVDLVLRRERVEVSVYFNAIAVLAMLAAVALSQLWHA
jgi:Ca-activated chloride channel family protein